MRVIALTIADEAETEALLDALVAAARRGVDVHVAADTFTYADAAGRFVPKRYLTKRRRASMDMARELTEAGATFDWLGQEGGLPWRGRTHTKFCVVDDTVYSFGGVNLDDQGATNADYMLRITDHRLAEDLVRVYARTRHANSRRSGFRSSALKYGKDQVLVDGGIPGDSIIYRRALKYARKSQRIVLGVPVLPHGRAGQGHRVQAPRDVVQPSAQREPRSTASSSPRRWRSPATTRCTASASTCTPRRSCST